MGIKKLDSKSLNEWVDNLIKKQRVIGVQVKGERFVFSGLKEAKDLRLDYDVTIIPPKKYLLPEREEIVSFKKDGTYTSGIDTEQFIIIGVHPYDVVAISQLDAAMKAKNSDTQCNTRRKNAVIIACDIENPSENVFASCMGTATVKEGFDILLTNIGNGSYLAEAKTENGEMILSASGGNGEVTSSELNARKQVWADNEKNLNRHKLNCSPKDIPKLLEETYDHPLWEEKAKLCYSCGSCNLVCPTCYCFDVRDEMDWDLRSGKRIRAWDACQLQDFAVVAGGHNFRKEAKSRLRHRIYKKGKYSWDTSKQIGCVGCGRCITACTTDIANPVNIYNRLLEVK